jgi:uncharacterized protein YkwD
LSFNASLNAAAQKYANLHFAYNPYNLSHNLDGNAQQRAAREGYSGWIGEVLVTGSMSPQVLFDTLMASPPHASILLGDYLEFGVGCAEGPYTTGGNTFQIALCVGLLGKR